VLDADILSRAPVEMSQAGVGDMAARAICNADWRLSNILKDTYFCPLPFQMTARSERSYLAVCDRIPSGDHLAIQDLNEAISISGLSMSILDGETSPSSGGEHVISHFWDRMSHLEGAARNLHGAQVASGTLIMLAAYEFIKEQDTSRLNLNQLMRKRMSLPQIEASLRGRFGESAGPLIEVSAQKYLPEPHYEKMVRKVIAEWDQMWNILGPYQSCSLETLRKHFIAAGTPVSLRKIQRNREQARDAILFGSRYRPRFTLLDLLWELGFFPYAADDILTRSGILDG
jgi:glycerol-1-phosphate dehydrogenase [NAD(P)+]